MFTFTIVVSHDVYSPFLTVQEASGHVVDLLSISNQFRLHSIYKFVPRFWIFIIYNFSFIKQKLFRKYSGFRGYKIQVGGAQRK